MQLWGQRIRLAICQDGRGSEKLRGLVVELGRVKGGIVVGRGGKRRHKWEAIFALRGTSFAAPRNIFERSI